MKQKLSGDVIEKKLIKLEKWNTDPTYLSNSIHSTFPRLQGQPFSLFHMEQNKPEMKALPTDVNNVVALLNYGELKRSHLYVKPLVSYQLLNIYYKITYT